MTYLYHNEQWQLTNTFHGSDADPYERYIHHAAGLYGGGGSSYIDRVILIDRDAGLDGTFETRLYPMQNFRADVIGMITDTGKQRGQTRYDPYGVPMGYMAGDVAHDNIWDGADLSILGTALNNSIYHTRYDENLDGTFDGADIIAFNNLPHTVGGARHQPALENSPFGYAGYMLDPDLAGSKMHVRNRVYLSDAGMWSRRDSIGYIDGTNLYNYVNNSPLRFMDPTGAYAVPPIRRYKPSDDPNHKCVVGEWHPILLDRPGFDISGVTFVSRKYTQMRVGAPAPLLLWGDHEVEVKGSLLMNDTTLAFSIYTDAWFATGPSKKLTAKSKNLRVNIGFDCDGPQIVARRVPVSLKQRDTEGNNGYNWNGYNYGVNAAVAAECDKEYLPDGSVQVTCEIGGAIAVDWVQATTWGTGVGVSLLASVGISWSSAPGSGAYVLPTDTHFIADHRWACVSCAP